jgi:DNA (cytosine-5)-methyltransferase 1
MTLGSLFDGISGFPLAASWCGIETKWVSEIDDYCLKVSKKNFPNAIQYGDIKEIGKGRKWEPEYVDIISGGFPCQPFSVAGNQQGKEDNRYLWPEMLRVITEVKPRWVIGENVPGIINMALDEVLASLENEGYKTETFIIPACSIGGPHRRDRVWIIAYTGLPESQGWEKFKKGQQLNGRGQTWGESSSFSGIPNASNTNSEGIQRGETSGDIKKSREIVKQFIGGYHQQPDWKKFPTQSPVCGRDDGIPNRVDRIKALGNAIVPQIAYEIFKAINEVEQTKLF